MRHGVNNIAPQPVAGMSSEPRYRIVIDGPIIDVHAHGVWSVAEVDAFFDALTPINAAMRVEHGRALQMMQIGAVQLPAVASHFRCRGIAMKRPGDRNALLFASVLSKLQVKRLATTENFAIFSDRAAAREWLLSND